jgi:uncharacterized protein (DUF2235 family)
MNYVSRLRRHGVWKKPMAKTIILLADGTGNAFLTQESNIWRIYQALDSSDKDQIAYYIPGVGTSSFKPCAMLDGATGFGVPSNVQKLYRFLCWNWEPGAEIYMFGFSRGAFTIRTLIDLVAKEGLLPDKIGGQTVTHAEMRRNSMAAWRSYCRKDPARNQNVWVMAGVRAIRDRVLEIWHGLWGHRFYEIWASHGLAPKCFDTVVQEISAQNRQGANINIAFAGLFDTVEAYGVPIEELRKAIHWFIWPIEFGKDHGISDKVARVRHALSLDDERTAFHPIRINKDKGPASNRVKEIWFAGVHSDVGGGYPDASLAHMPLVWMLEEAIAAGLILRRGVLNGFRKTASAFGPRHDSRAGGGVFYRYHPREINDENGDYEKTTMHYSVAERIVYGHDDYHDDYKPVSLPVGADVYMPDGSYFTHSLTEGFRRSAPANDATLPLPAPLIEARMKKALAAVKDLREPTQGDMNLARDFVWWRRVNYFALVFFLALLVLFPVGGDLIEDLWNSLFGPAGDKANAASGGVSNVFSSLVENAQKAAPAYVAPYIRALHEHPWIGATLVITFIGLLIGAGKLRDAIHDHASRAWSVKGKNIDDDWAAAGQSWLSRFFAGFARKWWTNPAWKNGYQWSKPVLSIAWFVVLFLVPLSIAANRVLFNYLVGSGEVCIGTNDPRYKPKPEQLQWIGQEPKSKRGYSGTQTDGFATSNPCWASGWGIERGVAYRLSIEIKKENSDQPWFDKLFITDVHGFESKGFLLGISEPMRRWPSAAWFHPIARIGDKGDAEWPLVAIDGGAPIPARGEKCTRLPIRYDETEEYKQHCKSTKSMREGAISEGAVPKPEKKCQSKYRELTKQLTAQKCETAKLDLPTACQLPKEELQTANAAWERNTFPWGNVGEQCTSAFPRRTFVSDFVAQQTGELFLFVNDAVVFPLGGEPQVFYQNNSGTATITLQRIPPPTAKPKPD